MLPPSRVGTSGFTCPHADRKIRRCRSRFLPPRSIRQNSAGGCLAARNQKEVSGETKAYGEALINLSLWSGRVFLSGAHRGHTQSSEGQAVRRYFVVLLLTIFCSATCGIIRAQTVPGSIEIADLPVPSGGTERALFIGARPPRATVILLDHMSA